MKKLRSRWYRPTWFLPAHRKREIGLQAQHTEPVTRSADGRLEYVRLPPRYGKATHYIVREREAA
jgi:hypothetical protein